MYKRIIKPGEAVGLQIDLGATQVAADGAGSFSTIVSKNRSGPRRRIDPSSSRSATWRTWLVMLRGKPTTPRNRHVESILSDIHESIGELLLLYAEEKSPIGTSQPTPSVNNTPESNTSGQRVIEPIPVDPNRRVKIRMTVLQRLAVLSRTNLTPGLKGRIEHSPLHPGCRVHPRWRSMTSTTGSVKAWFTLKARIEVGCYLSSRSSMRSSSGSAMRRSAADQL